MDCMCRRLIHSEEEWYRREFDKPTNGFVSAILSRGSWHDRSGSGNIQFCTHLYPLRAKTGFKTCNSMMLFAMVENTEYTAKTLTVAGRIRHIAGREPFKCHCIGLSTVREPVAHAAMRKWRIRSEWFHWCAETQQYGADTCDLCWVPRDGDDSVDRVIELANELDRERKVDDLARRLHAIHLQLQQT